MNNQIQLVLKSSTTELSLNDHELGIYLTPELDGLTGLPEIRTTSGVNAGYDGGWTSAQNYDARSITIRGVIANTDVATVERLRRQLTALAGQGKKEELTLDLVTEAGNAYTVQVRTIALEMALQKVVYQQEFMLQLRADDPLIYDASETGHEALLQVAQATGGFTIDFELPLAITGSSEETVVNNEGLEQVPTITRMYGALHNPKIINQTTNQFMQIEADLGYAEGDWIEPSEVVSGKDITINGAPEGAPLSSVKIDGNTTQQTYTGKNLFSVPSAQTKSGVTLSINSDGTVNIHGTNSSGSELLFPTYSDISIFSSTSYTLSASKTIPANLGARCEIYNGSTWLRSFVAISSTGQVNTQTPNLANGTRVRMAISIAKDATVNIDNIGFQLEQSSSATSFEPYVGGVPAPNPDYPQAVQTVTGENEVKICGKNLLEMPIESGSSNGITWAVQDDGSIILNGTSTAGVSIRANNVTMPAVEGETYTLSATGMGGAYNFGYKNSGSGENIFVVTSASPTTTAVVTSTMLSQANRLDMYIQSGKTFNNQRVTLQLEKGSQATTYEPYQEQSYPISLGSIELCKIDTYQDYIYKSGGKWYVHKETGKRTYIADDITIAASDTYSNVRYAQFPKGADNKQYGNYTYGDIINFFTHGINMGSVPAGGWNSYISDGLIYNSAMQDNYWCSFAKSTTLATMKEKLNGMVAYYVLATPTDTEITNEALAAQLEALAAATMYNPQTNITTIHTDGNEQPTLDVSYFTDKNPDTRDELVIDSRLRTITLNGLDVYHLQAPGSEFLMLAPGENRLSLQSDITGDNGYAQVSYKQGYLSI